MTPNPSTSQLRKSRRLKWLGGLFLALVLAAVAAVGSSWPFREGAVVKQLEEESFSKVSVGRFRRTYFPRPGCVLEEVVFRHSPKGGTPPLITVQRIRIEGSFGGLFHRHVKLIRVEGMRVNIPALGTEQFQAPPRSSVVIDHLVTDGATLEIKRAHGEALRFAFHNFTMNDIGASGPATFKAVFSNAEPPGEVTTTGIFGPWNAHSVGETPVSGKYDFTNTNLDRVPGISGMLSSSGTYRGILQRLLVEGATDIPEFAVDRSTHEAELRTRFRAEVNTLNGDVFLQSVDAYFRQTVVRTHGQVAGGTGHHGKTASFDFVAQEGRIQDLLLLFIQSPRPPMTGAVSFQGQVAIPSGDKSFLHKLRMQGDFGIAGSFTNSDTQRGVFDLSLGPKGEEKRDSKEDDTDPQSVLSDLKGHVLVEDGIATFSHLSFSVPGAVARLNGTYNLISESIDLRGALTTQKEVSKTTHGVKALFLKVLDPFLKNKSAGYTTPVKIGGTYDHPSFGLDLGGQKNVETKDTKRGNSHLRAQACH